MPFNFHQVLTYLDWLISQRLIAVEKNVGSEAQELKFLYISPEEVKTQLNLPPVSENPDVRNISFPEHHLPALQVLGKLFQLSNLEKKILLLILAPEIDSKYERIYAYLQDDLTRKYPTISLISLLLFEDETKRAKIIPYFLPFSPLLRFKLIRIENSENSFLSSPLRLEESVRNFLLGHYTLDKRLSSFCKIFPPVSEKRLPFKIASLISCLKQGIAQGKRYIFYLYGQTGTGKRDFALQIASALGYGLLVVNTPFILNDFAELLEIIFREALLSGTLVCFDNFKAFIEHEKGSLYEDIFFNNLKGFYWLVFCAGKGPWQPKGFLEQQFLSFPFSRPDYDTRCKLWEGHLEKIDPKLKKHSKELAQLFNFTEGEIRQVVHVIRSSKYIYQKVDKESIYKMCRERVRNKLSRLTQHLRLQYSWDDIVLPEDQLNQLKEIATCFRHQYHVFEKWGFKKKFINQGICALFTGPPGTGKTMSASIIAYDLGIEIYRIELSRVISKYIGETEKNLAKIFDAAEGAGVILFFDEADALFGKRTEIKDAHDRYANIEVSYLLQRIEEYNGLVILASNLYRNIDEAFIRRMHFIVEFPFPDAKMRKEIWAKVFPKEAPLDKDIDFEYLAKNFKLSGGSIRNAALRAAFYAAEEKEKINMEHVIKGIKRELQKMGKTLQINNRDWR